MVKGQLSRDADQRQGQVEDSLALIGAALVLLAHDTLRVRQAIQRSGLVDLLDPVIEDHRAIEKKLHKAQKNLRSLWDSGQKDRWK